MSENEEKVINPKKKISGLLLAGLKALTDGGSHPDQRHQRCVLQLAEANTIVPTMRKLLPNVKVDVLKRRFEHLNLLEHQESPFKSNENWNWGSWVQFSIVGCAGFPNECGEMGLTSISTIRTFSVILAEHKEDRGTALGLEVLFIHPPQGAFLFKDAYNTIEFLSEQFVHLVTEECWPDLDKYFEVIQKDNRKGYRSGVGSMVTCFSDVHGVQRILTSPF